MYARYITLASVLQRAQQKKKVLCQTEPNYSQPYSDGVQAVFFWPACCAAGWPSLGPDSY